MPRLRTMCSAGAVLVLVGIVGCGDDKPKPPVAASQLDDTPLTIAVSTMGMFAKGHSWFLSVNSAGQAELTILSFPERRKQFQLSKEQQAAFRKALVDERYFELASEYGQLVPDASEESITVTAGRNSQTVKVHFLHNWVRTDKAKLREPSRAVRLLVLVRGWFDDPEAVDLRESSKLVLDAAKE